MHRSYAVALTVALALAPAACGTKLNRPDCTIDPNTTQDPNEKVSFSAVKTLLVTNCGCHSALALNRQNAPTRVVLDTYNDAKTWADESRQALLGGTMPPQSNLTINQLCLFDAWYRNGMLP